MEEWVGTSPAAVQKYLTVVELTSSKRIETTDQSAILLALADRLKGMAQALDYQDGLGKHLSVMELYIW